MMKFSSLLFTLLSGVAFAQTDLILEDFQSGIPANYSIVDNDGLTPDASVSEYTAAWISTVDPDDNSNQVASATSYFTTAAQASRWLITPQLDLGAYGNYITWMTKSHDASYPDSYQVLISTTDNALSSFTDTLVNVPNEATSWTEHMVNLSEEGYDNQSVHIAFVLRTYDGFKLYMDSLHVWKEDPVSVPALAAADFAVYPNPFENALTVSSDYPVESLELLNASGQVVKTVQKTAFMNTADLPQGIYFLHIHTANNSAVRKLIKR